MWSFLLGKKSTGTLKKWKKMEKLENLYIFNAGEFC